MTFFRDAPSKLIEIIHSTPLLRVLLHSPTYDHTLLFTSTDLSMDPDEGASNSMSRIDEPPSAFIHLATTQPQMSGY